MLVIERHVRREKCITDARLKAKALAARDDSPGWIEGYAAVWQNLDAQNERMVKGCFARSIESLNDGKTKLMVLHFRDGGDARECIGTITKAKEDNFGLWIRAELSSTPDAQAIRAKILEGHIRGLSVGFIPVRYEIGEEETDARTIETVSHTECNLVEVTVTVRPANNLAEITAAKSRLFNQRRADHATVEAMRRGLEISRLRLYLLTIECQDLI